MEKFGKFCFGVLSIITRSLLSGYAFMKLWEWFIVYAFHVQTINLIQSIGLVFFWGYLKPKKKDEPTFTEAMATEAIQTVPLVGQVASSVLYSSNPVPIIKTMEELGELAAVYLEEDGYKLVEEKRTPEEIDKHKHLPADILTDSNNQFVTLAQISQWNSVTTSQFWKDAVTLLKSDWVRDRIGSLKTDIHSEELADQASNIKNHASALIASLLKVGFLPTQAADATAIIMGGAPFYRNRIKTYEKSGMSKEASEKQALLDFIETADESQQSSRPDKISQQQASSLGRIVLAFANTPMQYSRLMKKATLDLINGRGDWKTNISKILYYGALQNIIFSGLQSALFAALFDDDEEKEDVFFKKTDDEGLASSFDEKGIRCKYSVSC